jgi:benzodiazapine receptor
MEPNPATQIDRTLTCRSERERESLLQHKSENKFTTTTYQSTSHESHSKMSSFKLDTEKVEEGIVVDENELLAQERVEENASMGNASYPNLNVKNYVNVVAFLTNIVVNYLIGVAGFAPYSVGGLSDLYQTIISPDSYAFSIWSLIFISQGIFCVAQLLRRFRGLPIVQDGISWYFISANVFQTAWIFAWCWGQVTVALILILGVCASLNALVINLHLMYTKESSSFNKTYLEYWLFQFPFHIHCGWITAASSLNVNIQFIFSGVEDPSIQLAVGIVTLAVLHAIALVWLYMAPGSRPNFTIPLVLAWANAAIAVELSNPKDTIVERFGEVITQAIMYAAGVVAVIIGCLCISRFTLDAVRTKFFGLMGSESKVE